MLAHNYPPQSLLPGRSYEDLAHTRLRRRILEGRYDQDAAELIAQRVGPLRAQAWGRPSILANPLRDLSAAVAVLYVEEPDVAHPTSAAAADEIAERSRLGGLWLACGRAQHLTEALNDCAIHAHVSSSGGISLRVVSPDLLDVRLIPSTPEAGWLREARARVLGGRAIWTVDEYDVMGEIPTWRVLDTDGADRTVEALGQSYSGDAYPYRYRDGRPFVPYSLRHAQAAQADVFAPWVRRETVNGTLESVVYQTLIAHIATQASFPLTFAINARIAGNIVHDGDGKPIASAPVLDPAAIHTLEQIDGTGQPSIAVVRNETDPRILQDLAMRVHETLATSWGLGAADLQRTAADSRSGLALAVSSAGRRRMQSERAPIYRDADERLLGKIAAQLNARGVGGITDRPEWGYRVSYGITPLSESERAQIQSEVQFELANGLISRAEARARIHGEDIATAARAVARIQEPA